MKGFFSSPETERTAENVYRSCDEVPPAPLETGLIQRLGVRGPRDVSVTRCLRNRLIEQSSDCSGHIVCLHQAFTYQKAAHTKLRHAG